MRYFWHAIISIGLLALIVFVFFAFSINVEDRITFTDTVDEITEPTVTIADPQQGPSDAPVTIVNFGDYGCAACADLEEALTAVVNEYGDEIRIVWKDMPNTTSHPEALNAAMAAHCAAKQDEEIFFLYHDYLFANQADLGTDLYGSVAEALGLQSEKLLRCIENQDTYALVQRGYDEGIALKVTATPTLFINGERYTGGMGVGELKATVRGLLR
ncbi:thioredoxin domain-containing protein [Candidatus Uhrbacteria bacterium]|nr:thioredoxin domain-containing protein [Candidatus Uhrbacteria bacterium]